MDAWWMPAGGVVLASLLMVGGERYGPQPSYGSSVGGAESRARPERAPRQAPTAGNNGVSAC